MKNILLAISLILIARISLGQGYWDLHFDDTAYHGRVFIDKISNTNNIWQIGHPSKTIFNSAYSASNAIVTDTLNPYPINDTSSFIITHYRNRPDGGGCQTLLLDFYFKLNIDSGDFGIIEASIDSGVSWINLLTQDSIYDLYWYLPKPDLNENTNGWVHYSQELRSLNDQKGPPSIILYRFTFISDSIQTNKEGWMLDNFHFVEVWEGIDEIQHNNLISIFPNPASDQIQIHRIRKGYNQNVQVLNYSGQVLYNDKRFIGEVLDVSHFSNGIYFLKYSDEHDFSISKFVVQH